MKRLIRYIDDLLRAAFSRIQRSTELPERTSAQFRIVFGLFLLACYLPYFGWMRDAPPGFFNPHFLSPTRLMTGFPTGGWLLALDVGIVITSCCLTIGWFTRAAGLLFVVIYVFGSSCANSFGKIDHAIMLAVTVFCFSFSNWGCYYAVRPDKRLRCHAQMPALLALLLAFAMFTAGFEKLIRWVDFDTTTSGFMRWFYIGYFNLNRRELLADYVFQLPPIAAELMDYAAVVFELSPLACLLIGPRCWKAWLLIACLFHLANTLLLNIPFLVNIPVYLPFLMHPTASRSRFAQTHRALVCRYFVFASSVVMGVVHLAERVICGIGGYHFFIPMDRMSHGALLMMSVWLWAIMSLLAVLSLAAQAAHSPKRASSFVDART